MVTFCRGPFSPLPYQNVDGEGHDESGDEQVGHGEGHDEEVGDVLEELLPTHAQDHEHVAEDDEDAELHSARIQSLK